MPSAILAEIDYLLREFLGVEAELDFLASLRSGAFELERDFRSVISRSGKPFVLLPADAV